MTSQKKTASPSGPSRPPPPFEKSLQDTDLESFNRLVSKGVPRGCLNFFLDRIPKTPKSTFKIVEGWADKTLISFPDRVIDFAAQLEKVTFSPCMKDSISTYGFADLMIYIQWKGKRSWTVLEEFAEFTDDADWENGFDFTNIDFLQLPRILRFFATFYLRPLISNWRNARYKLDGQKWLILSLSEFVNACIGHYFDSEVARLLNAAFKFAGQDEGWSGGRFDPNGLSKLRSTNKKLAPAIDIASPFGLSPHLVRILKKSKSWPIT